MIPLSPSSINAHPVKNRALKDWGGVVFKYVSSIKSFSANIFCCCWARSFIIKFSCIKSRFQRSGTAVTTNQWRNSGLNKVQLAAVCGGIRENRFTAEREMFIFPLYGGTEHKFCRFYKRALTPCVTYIAYALYLHKNWYHFWDSHCRPKEKIDGLKT